MDKISWKHTCVIDQIRGAGGGIGVNQRRRQSSATTANVDIEVPAAIMTGSGEKYLQWCAIETRR